MPFKDVRGFIAKLEKESEAVRIEEEVDWNLEAGAMVGRASEVGLPERLIYTVAISCRWSSSSFQLSELRSGRNMLLYYTHIGEVAHFHLCLCGMQLQSWN